jgi:hypothetical protein
VSERRSDKVVTSQFRKGDKVASDRSKTEAVR